MEHKQRKSMRMMLSFVFFAMAAFIISSCNKNADATFSAENTQTSNNESSQESNSDELDDLAEVALNSQVAASGGRTSSVTDDRLICDGTTIVATNVSTDKSSGTVTITFGPNGCLDKKGNTRKGSIVISWSGGKWYRPGATHTITLNGYSINGLGISGTRTLTTASVTGTLTDFSITWNITANHTFTWTDGTATRTVNKSKTWAHSAAEDTFTITNGPSSAGANAAAGTNRHGKEYTMNITAPLVYIASCIKTNKVFLPVSGIKVLIDVAKAKTLTIDFGTTTCDNTFTVTVDGVTKTLSAKNDSSAD
jgi:hypothetical protein